ncbi:MAG: GNAT family N-acetyltransferase [Betaproteobacteria bacterium]|nr:GNAT family N-acetyltransferase [Betaproteobacteria bacterium]
MAQDKRDNNSLQMSAQRRSFSVRTMEIEDLAEVYQLGAMNFKADLWPMLYRSWDEYEVTTLFNTDGDYCLVAENDDWVSGSKDQRIVGFVLGTVISKPGSAWSYGYVLWLCSHDDWAREGVAGKLVDKLVEIMVEEDGIRIIMADTDPDNHRAVRFFAKKGFTDTKPHLYLSSNLEHNPHYAPLLKKSRAAAQTAERKKKKKRRDAPARLSSMGTDEKKRLKKKKLKKRKKKKKKSGKV